MSLEGMRRLEKERTKLRRQEKGPIRELHPIDGWRGIYTFWKAALYEALLAIRTLATKPVSI